MGSVASRVLAGLVLAVRIISVAGGPVLRIIEDVSRALQSPDDRRDKRERRVDRQRTRPRYKALERE